MGSVTFPTIFGSNSGSGKDLKNAHSKPPTLAHQMSDNGSGGMATSQKTSSLHTMGGSGGGGMRITDRSSGVNSVPSQGSGSGKVQ